MSGEPPGLAHRVLGRLRGTGAATTFVLGTALALATFTFQTAQVWVDEGDHDRAIRWLLPLTLSLLVMTFSGLLLAGYLLARKPPGKETEDPYRRYADGILAMGEVLHREQRDPALLRLRANSSLTLHVWGFHEERVRLGALALESAQFTHDQLTEAAILTDDLGWANYLLGRREAATNIERAIDILRASGEALTEPQRSLLLAKAHRHLGVIRTAQKGELVAAEFREARDVLQAVHGQASREVEVDLTHLAHAEALAIASMLGVNSSGAIRPSDTEGTLLLRRALGLARQATEGFRAAGDQGRYAKSLVLQVRILEALHETDAARQLSPLRDRAVAASVWSRPDGVPFITGR